MGAFDTTGMVFDIAHSSFVDGPGLRTTVFFKGCNLRCDWCHNPESQNHAPCKMFYADKCIGCGACKSVCPSPKKCLLCGRCGDVCPTGAVSVCGKRRSVRDILSEVLRDRDFYGLDGGVTFSGGECMLQIDFLETLLKACKERGLHTCVDTAGNVPFALFERVSPFTDLFLYDIKAVSPEKHLAWTGADNAQLLFNFKRLYALGVKILVRVPVIPERNGDMEEMRKIAEFLAGYPEVPVELLAYHRLGESKYAGLGLSADGHTFTVPDKAYMDKRKRLFKNPLL
ncbi:MAG: glycyl-radical enzyme activating protein [Eubacteriales bacterium]|jgi:glycyl-radical enzyme activating protein